MKETGNGPTVHDSPFTSYSHHQFGVSSLETLPEEEGDNDDEFQSGTSSPDLLTWSPHHHVQPHRSSLSKLSGDEGESGRTDNMQPTIRHEIERQRAKVSLLEATIRQLRDELRESKDQNELLEFRLLELGDPETSPPSPPVHVDSTGKRRNSVRKSDDESGVDGQECGSGTSQGGSVYGEGDGAEVSSEVTGHERRSNLAEARSSCSDCSESLSFQESGIFESQFPDDGYSMGGGGRSGGEEVNQELSRLLSHIESLLTREPTTESSTKIPRTSGGNHVDPVEPSVEFLLCRQRLQEFGRNISKCGNDEYLESLERKIVDLVNESRKLEEERAEMEEAENDSRNMCQRLDEKVKRMKLKREGLEGVLSDERRLVELLRMEVGRLQDREGELMRINSSLEISLQSQEQLNFDLEESLIEFKDTLQFLLFLIPLFFTWNRWRRKQQKPQRMLALPPFYAHSTKKVPKFAEIGTQTSLELLPFPCSHRNHRDGKSLPDWSPREGEFEEKIRGVEETARGKGQDLEICEKKLMRLEEEWEWMMKELEELKMEFPMKSSNDSHLNLDQSGIRTGKYRQGSLVANRIRSLFHQPNNPPTLNLSPKRPPGSPRMKRVDELLHGLRTKIEQRMTESVGHHDGCSTFSKDRNAEIVHLRGEINRLERLLKEEEERGMERKLAEVEGEVMTLRSELKNTAILQRKLEESQSALNGMMNRVEELEEAEMNWKQEMGQNEQKTRRDKESMTWLRSEVDLLTNKIVSLQDEIQSRIQTENLHRDQISILQSQFKEAEKIIQDKELLLLESATHFRDKISRLEAQVDEGKEELGDVECSNGMLKEEILYFERVLGEVSERGDQNEKLVQILTSKLQERENQIGLLKRDLAEVRRGVGGFPRNYPSNDLDVFARNDGGLKGVCRDVREVIGVLNNCVLCKCGVGMKLVEVLDQLTTLTQMLEGSQQELYGMETRPPSLSRCESEEHLSSSILPQPTLAKWRLPEVGALSSPLQRCQVEEHKTLKLNLEQLERELLKKDDEIRGLFDKRRVLSSQLKGLDEMRVMREKELRESHLNESWWWKFRCHEKNELIQILALGIVHLSAIQSQGSYLLDRICSQITKVGESYPGERSGKSEEEGQHDLNSTSLLAYFNGEKSRIQDILESCSCSCNSNTTVHSQVTSDFQVVRRIGEDGLLLSWCPTHHHHGYEIKVNGETHLSVVNPIRWSALLFGLNMAEPIQLTLTFQKNSHVVGQENGSSNQESSITYIA